MKNVKNVNCKTCEEGNLEPMMLDQDGVKPLVSGNPGTWCHAYEDSWWPCTAEVYICWEGPHTGVQGRGHESMSQKDADIWIRLQKKDGLRMRYWTEVSNE